MSDLRSAVMRGPRVSASILFLSIVAFFVGAVFWASVATLDEVTTGEGRVIPSSQIQVLQNLEGGILAKIHVREGEIVEQSQVLLTIDDTQAASKYREDRARVLALRASVARLRAEQEGKPPEFPDEVVAERPDLVETELAVYGARTNELRSAIEVYRRQIEQRQQELVELDSRIGQLTENLALGHEELGILAPLVEQGVSARIELIRLQRQVNDIEGDLKAARQSVPRARSALNEVRRRVEERRAAYLSEVATTLAAARGELASVSEVMASAQDRVRRTEVRSPVQGTVIKLYINTIGGVIRPGEDLLEIVPLEDNLLVEAQIRPADIAFLRPGQAAQVKITAYDFAIYGGIDAELEQISADTILNEDGERFYQIRVRTNRNFMVDRKGVSLPIIPGMVAEVDILTGKKTVLQYLMKPILRAGGRAMRER
jgi:adhesin transport system membrane fusion protein